MKSCKQEKQREGETEKEKGGGKKKRGKKYTEKKKNINPSVVEIHVTVVTLEAMSTNRAKHKLVWKRQVV